MKHVHVVTNIDPRILLKQSPHARNVIDGIFFSFGFEVPNGCDAIIVYALSKYSLDLPLSRGRVAYLASEPADIARLSDGFLAQFGTVSCTYESLDNSPRRIENYCSTWYAGLPLHEYPSYASMRGWEYFDELCVPEKEAKISVIASIKSNTELHRKREGFIRLLSNALGDRLVVFGANYRSVNDKIDALLPFRYNLALENSAGPYTWTEKLTDPLLCWSFPFHVGCSPETIPFPSNSFMSIDIDNPTDSVGRIVDFMDRDGWRESLAAISEARRAILDEYNIMQLFTRIARALLEAPKETGGTRVFSERFWTDSAQVYRPAEGRLRKIFWSANPTFDYYGYKIKKSGMLSSLSQPFRQAKRTLRRLKNEAVNSGSRS